MKNKFEHPFSNDMLGVVWQAFKNLYTEKVDKIRSICWIVDVHEFVEDKPDEETLGFTRFNMESNVADIMIGANITVYDSVYVFAHELAHVAVGPEHKHDDVFQCAYDSLCDEYNRIVDDIVKH